MPNVIGKFASAFIFIFIFILSNVIIILFMTIPLDTRITNETVKFVNECQTTGRIDPQNLKSYMDVTYGLGYDIEIIHGSLRSYPSDVSGEYFEDYYDHILSEILDDMYASGSAEDYIMKYGDELTVRVIRNDNIMTRLVNWIFKNDLSKTEVTRYSGKIGNSNASIR